LRIVVALGVLALATACTDGGTDASRDSSTASIDPSTSELPTTMPTESDDGGVDAERISFDDLLSGPEELVGTTVEVDGKVFLDPNCPPPDGQSGPCILNAYLADPDRTGLTAAEIADAFPITEDGVAVSCVEQRAGAGCSGWEHAQRYRVVAVVNHRVSGGRATEQFELDAKSKTPI
jgi:hypothetical protein